MTEPQPVNDAGLAPSRGRDVVGGPNTAEPAAERRRRTAREDPAPTADFALTPPRSTRPGDLPQAVRTRYFGEPARLGPSVSFYEGPGAKRAAFHDHGAKLQTEQSHPAVARDLAAIAAHRGWTHIRVRGEDEFRRQVWLEARSLGLEVSGYRPRERDREELERTRAAEEAKTAAREERRRRSEAPPERGASVAARAAEGVILETGTAPYRRRQSARPTPYVRLDRGTGPALEVWGAGLPEALARSGAAVGDRVVVRRDGVEKLDRLHAQLRPPDLKGPTRLDDGVVFAAYDADRFRRASPAQAARDPDLKGAQSHLAVLDAVIDRMVRDPERRTRLHAEAREIVADEMAQGRRFPPAQVRDVEPVLARDVAEAFQRERAPERARTR